jgi:hypothetical protein
MDDDDFSSRMERDQGFRAAVLQVARDSCALNPFSGGRNPGCADINNVVRRQAAFGQETRKTVVQSNPSDNVMGATERGDDWLSQLSRYGSPGGTFGGRAER